jgi:hypothetical protein
MSKRKKLYNISYRFRKKLLGESPSKECCFDASWGLVAELRRCGIPAHVVKGHFLARRCYPLPLTRLRHYWVKSGRYIIDITADQFNTHIVNVMPKVHISMGWSEFYKMEESLAS